MSRVAFCLLFIAIIQNVIQANKTSTEVNPIQEEQAKDEPAADKVATDGPVPDKVAKDEPTDDKTAKEEPAKDKTVEEPAGKQSPVNNNDKPNDAKTSEAKEVPKEEIAENGRRTENTSTKTTTINTSAKAKPPLDFAGNILGPVMIARAKIEDVVHKGVDGARDFADGAFNFFKDTVTKIF